MSAPRRHGRQRVLGPPLDGALGDRLAAKRLRSLRRQYFAVFLTASVVPVLLTGTASILSAQDALATRTAQDNTILAQSVATAVENQIREISGSAEEAAGNATLRAAAPSSVGRSEKERALESVAVRHREFEAFGIADSDAQVVAYWPPSAAWMDGHNLSDEAFVAVHISVNGSYQTTVPTFVGSVFSFAGGGGSQGPYIPVSTVIRDDVEAVHGILIGFVEAGFFASAVPPLPSRELTALLFDGGGNVIASRTSAGMTPHVTPSDLAARDEALSTSRAGNFRSTGPEPSIIAYAPATSGQARWVFVLRLPVSQVISDASNLLFLSVGIMLVAAVVSALVAGVLARRTVGPIVALTEATQDLERARDLPATMTDRQDELGTLSRSFAKMATAVKDEAAANRRLIARLEELERLKSALIDTVSHELRTPITVIRGNAEILALDGGGSPEKTLRTMQRIVSASDQLAYLVEELIELGQLQARQSTLRPIEVDFNALVGQVRDLESESAQRAGVQFVVAVDASAAPLQADPSKLRIAVRNLVSNAVKFSSRGGTVTLTTRAKEGGVELTVRDEGVGIKPEAMPHIFEVFYQPDASLTRSHGGAGIGLALVHQFIELHGGKLAVESVAGKGATFTAWIPSVPLPPDSD